MQMYYSPEEVRRFLQIGQREFDECLMLLKIRATSDGISAADWRRLENYVVGAQTQGGGGLRIEESPMERLLRQIEGSAYFGPLLESLAGESKTVVAEPAKCEDVRIGDYRIKKKIGQGGVAEVYLAERPGGGECALKVVGADAEQFSRFMREAKICKELKHEYIVELKDVGYCKASRKLYLAMEYAEGNLETLLANRKLDEKSALRIALPIAEALEYLHGMGLLHRDIKPANILFCDKVAKLADMGLAKNRFEENGMTQTGTTLGTLYYMPNEQIEDAKRVDVRADVYSLGATLYHMLAGQAPYQDAGGTMPIIEAKRNGDLPSLAAYCPEVSPATRQLVEKAMARDPKSRHQSAAELKGELGKVWKSIVRGDAQ